MGGSFTPGSWKFTFPVSSGVVDLTEIRQSHTFLRMVMNWLSRFGARPSRSFPAAERLYGCTGKNGGFPTVSPGWRRRHLNYQSS